MKKALAILLTLSIIAQSMVNLLLCAYYEVNKKQIAEKLCVNKNKPLLHCNGQCYLGKQLKKAEENEKRPRSFREKDEVVVICPLYNGPYMPVLNVVGFLTMYVENSFTARVLNVPDRPPQA